MTAAGASLTGVTRVDEGHAYADGFRLVGDKTAQLCEAPAMQTAVESVRCLHPLADVGQVFQNDGPTRWDAVNDAAGEDVVAISSEACLFAPEDSQAALCRLGSFGLALAFLTKQTGFDVLPLAFAEEPPLTGDGWTVDPQINTNRHIVCLDDGGWRFDGDVQGESSAPMHEVCRANLAPGRPGEDGGEMKRDNNTTGRGGKRCCSSGPVDLERVDVVAGWACGRVRARSLPPLLAAGKCRLDGLCCLDASLDVQIAHKGWKAVFQ